MQRKPQLGVTKVTSTDSASLRILHDRYSQNLILNACFVCVCVCMCVYGSNYFCKFSVHIRHKLFGFLIRSIYDTRSRRLISLLVSDLR